MEDPPRAAHRSKSFTSTPKLIASLFNFIFLYPVAFYPYKASQLGQQGTMIYRVTFVTKVELLNLRTKSLADMPDVTKNHSG